MRNFLKHLPLFLPILSLHTEEKSIKEIIKAERKWVEQQTESLLKKPSVNANDVLSSADQGKTFEPPHEDHVSPQSQELQGFFAQSQKKESLDGSEELFQVPKIAINQPEEILEMTPMLVDVQGEEKRLEKCLEEGNYQTTFIQKRVIQVIPEIKQSSKKCEGHTKSKPVGILGVSRDMARIKEILSSRVDIEEYTIDPPHRGGTCISYWYRHKDNTPSCNHSVQEEVISQPYAEKEEWVIQDTGRLKEIQETPSCSYLFSKVLEGPETRQIEGYSFFRDTWATELIFSCSPDKSSPCARLRNQGGVIVNKKCLKTSSLGDCELWEKTYDLNQQVVLPPQKNHFKDAPIRGLDESLNSSYEKNTDFGEVISTLSVFSALEKDIQQGGKEFREADVKIFEGEKLKCERSFLEGNLFDCCRKMEGLAINVHLAKCHSEEQILAEKRNAGKCHYIGSYSESFHTKTKQVFCCFPSKLARVLHEQGRKQLGIKWGSAEKPKCRGLTLQELRRLDFTHIDLSEVMEDIQLNQEELTQKIRASVQKLQLPQASMQPIIKSQEEVIKK